MTVIFVPANGYIIQTVSTEKQMNKSNEMSASFFLHRRCGCLLEILFFSVRKPRYLCRFFSLLFIFCLFSFWLVIALLARNATVLFLSSLLNERKFCGNRLRRKSNLFSILNLSLSGFVPL